MKAKYVSKCLLFVPIAALLIAMGFLVGCDGGATRTVTIAGSTTVQPLAETLGTKFHKVNPDIDVEVLGGGSSVGVTSAADGTVDIGAASRDLKPGEPALAKHLLARDGVAIVVHHSNPVSGLTKEQVRGIFAGAITKWSQVGGSDQNIAVVAREEASGTRAAFEELVMEGEAITRQAILQISNGTIRGTVSTTQNSIGFLSFGFLDGAVKALAIDGVEATEANAKDGTYLIVRPLYFLTREQPQGLVKDFIDFCLGEQGQQVVADEGYIPIN